MILIPLAAAMALTGRIPVFLFASTAMLVSAGFAFNEIFVYWFPNFLFASLLLALICGLHLFHEKAVVWGQALFAGPETREHRRSILPGSRPWQ